MNTFVKIVMFDDTSENEIKIQSNEMLDGCNIVVEETGGVAASLYFSADSLSLLIRNLQHFHNEITRKES